MNNNYDTSGPDSPYWVRAGESLNLAVNAVADVLHTLYISSNAQPTSNLTPSQSPLFSPTETPYSIQNPTPTSTIPEFPPTTILFLMVALFLVVASGLVAHSKRKL
jgi:hypothetical protein